MTWAPVTHEGITATVVNVEAGSWMLMHKNDILGIDAVFLPREDWNKIVARVVLNGPSYTKSEWKDKNPRRTLYRPRLPQTFELVGRNRNGVEVVKYGFVLRQWFANRGDVRDTAFNQAEWCRRAGYRLAKVRDLTNAKCARKTLFPCGRFGDDDGATPSSGFNGYQRRIGAGFFTEWGPIPPNHYADIVAHANVVNDNYWTDNYGLTVYSSYGIVYKTEPSYSHHAFCVTP
ncbi:hypothetical protein A9G24_10800 [Gilliamella sp. App6-5]|nr:hypothetical protein A9G24_10800 [Gilliamella apicola]